LSFAGAGLHPPAALAPKLLLEAPDLCLGQLGQPTDDLLYTRLLP